MRSAHLVWGEIAVWINGLVGLWGLILWRRGTVPRAFYWGVAVAITSLLFQVVNGVVVMNVEEIDPGDQHVFYGGVIAATFSFAYIYRAQFRKQPALYYGLLLLFTMGLGIRGIMTFGRGF
ncbi:MAG TPA: hypothetical protein VG872_05460 [Acidimicrobiia bacterium]|nr:hypothetical protein [Acidimicrobiia bacterium]